MMIKKLGSRPLVKTLARISSPKYNSESLASLERACLYYELLDIVDKLQEDYDDPEITDYFEDIKRAATHAYGDGTLFTKSEHFVHILKDAVNAAQSHVRLHYDTLCQKGLHDFRRYTNKGMTVACCHYCGHMPTAEDLLSEAEREKILGKLKNIYRSFPTIFFQPETCLDVLSTRANVEELNNVLRDLKERMPVIVQEHAQNYQAKIKPVARLNSKGDIEFSLSLIENGSATEAVRPQRLGELNKLNSLLAKIEI